MILACARFYERTVLMDEDVKLVYWSTPCDTVCIPCIFKLNW
jgi:hypothetical protein